MQFVLADLYYAGRRERMARAGGGAELAPIAFTQECPRCGLVYVANGDLTGESWRMQAIEIAAQVQLDRECPDHPHTFVAPE